MFKPTTVASFIAALLFSAAAQAAVVPVNSQAQFSSLGTVAQNTNFDSFSGDFSFPGDNYTVGDLKFTGPGNTNLVTGNGQYGFNRHAMTNNHWTPVVGEINTAPTYDLFGFNMGVGGQMAGLTINLATNLNTYSFVIENPPTSSSMEFFGFAAGAGEFFQSFAINSNFSSGSLAGITDVQLGNAAAVPEPSTYVLLGLGLFGMAISRRKQGKANNA